MKKLDRANIEKIKALAIEFNIQTIKAFYHSSYLKDIVAFFVMPNSKCSSLDIEAFKLRLNDILGDNKEEPFFIFTPQEIIVKVRTFKMSSTEYSRILKESLPLDEFVRKQEAEEKYDPIIEAAAKPQDPTKALEFSGCKNEIPDLKLENPYNIQPTRRVSI